MAFHPSIVRTGLRLVLRTAPAAFLLSGTLLLSACGGDGAIVADARAPKAPAERVDTTKDGQ